MNNQANTPEELRMQQVLKDNAQDHLTRDLGSPRKGLFIVKRAYQWIEEAMMEPEPRPLFDQFWQEGELCILFADTNTGKSILAVQIGDSISRGVPIPRFEMKSEPQQVIYLDFELSKKQFEARYSDGYRNHYVFHPYFIRAEMEPDDEQPYGCNTMEDCIIASIITSVLETGARIVIIDNITYMRSETEQAKDALPLMKELKKLKKDYQLSILALAHTPKRDATKPITRNDLQGSKMLMNFCDSSFCIGESHKDTSLRYLKQIKVRAAEMCYPANNVVLCRIEKPLNFLQFTHCGYGDEYEHLKTGSETDREELIREVKRLNMEEGLSQNEIAKRLNISVSTVNKYVHKDL